MKYKSVFSISFDAPSDAQAQSIARTHHDQMRDDLRIEGADHPYELTLEQVLALESGGSRNLLPEPTPKSL